MEKESKQEGAAKEQVKEKSSEPVSPVTPPEEKKTSERTYSEPEWRKMQSMKDIESAKAQRLERENQALRDQQQQQLLVARQKEIEALGDDPEGQARAKYRHNLEDSIGKLEKNNEELANKMWNKYDQAIDLASQHNLSLADARSLMEADTPKEAELRAQLLVAEKAKVTEESPPKEGFPTPDSGTSDAGSESDKAFMKSYSEGKSDDHVRAQKILAKTK